MWDEHYNQKLGGSCDLSFGSFAQATTKSTGMEHIPAEKLREMQAYAVMLRKKHPSMKPKRLMRKVAEHFKIELT